QRKRNVMTQAHPRTVAATASGLAGCLLLAACGSSSPTHANTSASQPRNDAAYSSAAPAGSTGTPLGSSSPTSGTSSAPRPAAAGALIPSSEPPTSDPTTSHPSS